jgi:hypothetical protein
MPVESKAGSVIANNQTNVEPAYAEGFGVAGAHLSPRSEAKEERPTPNVQFSTSELGVRHGESVRWRIGRWR